MSIEELIAELDGAIRRYTHARTLLALLDAAPGPVPSSFSGIRSRKKREQQPNSPSSSRHNTAGECDKAVPCSEPSKFHSWSSPPLDLEPIDSTFDQPVMLTAAEIAKRRRAELSMPPK